MAKKRLLDTLEVTGLRPEDTAFLQDTWANAYRVADECSHMPSDAFHPWHRARRKAILERPDTLVLVARDREAPLWVAGYGVFEKCGDAFVAHWVYVKKHCKRQGVAGRLLAKALERIGDGAQRFVGTHRTWFTPHAVRALPGLEFVKLEDLYGGRVGGEA